MEESPSEEVTPQDALFSHLAPPEHKPTQLKFLNLALKQKIDRQLHSKTTRPRPSQKGKSRTRSRSR